MRVFQACHTPRSAVPKSEVTTPGGVIHLGRSQLLMVALGTFSLTEVTLVDGSKVTSRKVWEALTQIIAGNCFLLQQSGKSDKMFSLGREENGWKLPSLAETFQSKSFYGKHKSVTGLAHAEKTALTSALQPLRGGPAQATLRGRGKATTCSLFVSFLLFL